MADYVRSSVRQGSILTPQVIMNLQDGMQNIIDTQNDLKDKLIAILKDKDITASSSESLSDLIYRFNSLTNTVLNGTEYSEDLVNITKDIKSKQIKLLYLDGREVGFRIYFWKTDKVAQTKTGTFQVDWGDGTIETYTNTDLIKHTFASGSGVKYDDTHNQHVVTINPVDCEFSGFYNSTDHHAGGTACLLAFASKDVYFNKKVTFYNSTLVKYIDFIGGSVLTSDESQSLGSSFRNLKNLERVSGSVCWTSCNTINDIFNGTENIERIDLGEVWNTENCTNGSSAFYGCYKLKTVPGINTSKMTSVSNMFYNCNELTKINCNYFNLEKVTSTLNNLFYNCYELEDFPRLLNTSNVTGFSSTFYSCRKLKKLKQDTLDTSKATTVDNMFSGCTLLEEAPTMDFNSVTIDSRNIFYNCESLYVTQNTFNFNSLIGTNASITNTSSVSGIDGMFTGCISLTAAPTINAPYVKSVRNLFSGCINLVSVPKTMSYPEAISACSMFSACTSLAIAPAVLELPKCENVANLFSNCTNLQTTPYPNGKWDLSGVTYTAQSLLDGCSSLVNVSNEIDLRNCQNVSAMYRNCSALKTLPTLNLDKATNTSYIFQNCTGITDLRGKTLTLNSVSAPISLLINCTALIYPFDTITLNSATNITSMFNGCAALLQAPEIIAPNVTTANSVFYNCSSLLETKDYYFPKLVSAQTFCYGCTSLKKFGEIKTDAPTLNLNQAIYNATSLEEISSPVSTSGNVVWANFLFSNSTTLTKISGELDMSCGVAFTTMFPTNGSQNGIVGSVTFKGLKAKFDFTTRSKVTSIRLTNPQSNMQSFNITGCGLGTSALNNLFTDLPIINNGSTISVTGNPGALSCNTSIATKKGWTVVVK